MTDKKSVDDKLQSEHIIDGEFQSDKYPDTPKGLIPFKVTDRMAQDLLAIYAYRRAKTDNQFSEDIFTLLRSIGYDPRQVLTEEGYRLTYKDRSS